MALIAIHGVTLQTAEASIDPDTVGEGFARAQGGLGRQNFQAFKQHIKGRTVPLTQAEGFAWYAVLTGQTDHWGFAADLYSDKGYGPTASSGATQAAGGRNGSSKLTLAATTGNITYAVTTTNGVTFCAGRYESGAWADYALTWSAAGALTAVYRNGTAQAVSLPSWIVYTSTSIQLTNTAASAQDFCELAVINAPAPTAWLSALNTWRASNNQATAPRLTVAGDIHPIALTMFGKVGGTKNMMVVVGGAFADNARVIDFELMEA